jgi:beta-xylosidase
LVAGGVSLPVTLPRHVGQVPIHHGQHPGSGYRRTEADIHKGYLDMPSTPLFPFGHGLSHTPFDYGPLELASDTVDMGGEAEASVTVTNSGDRRGLLACSGAHAVVPREDSNLRHPV